MTRIRGETAWHAAIWDAMEHYAREAGYTSLHDMYRGENMQIGRQREQGRWPDMWTLAEFLSDMDVPLAAFARKVDELRR